MRDEIEKLNSRLDRLQFGDKLFSDEPALRGVFAAQLRGLMMGHG